MVHVPKILPLSFAHDKNGDKQFWEEKLHATEWEALHAHSKVPHSFPFGLGWVHGMGEISFHFFHSQCVLIRFPMAFHHIPTICYRLIIYACYFVTIFVDKKVKG
jgi:hypothetical protein